MKDYNFNIKINILLIKLIFLIFYLNIGQIIKQSGATRALTTKECLNFDN